MRLQKAQVTHFKSIDDSTEVTIDPKVTVLVGQNEAGKTCFLQALEKSRPIREGVAFDITEDYPRKSLNVYRKSHDTNPATVVALTYELEATEIKRVNDAFGAEVLTSSTFVVEHKYGGGSTISLAVNERPFIQRTVADANLPSEIAKLGLASTTVRELVKVLESADLNTEGQTFLDGLKERFNEALKESTWAYVVGYEAWHQHIGQASKFLYFGDYQLLPGKVSLQRLSQRVAKSESLTEEDQTVLRLLDMAEVDLEDLVANLGYEAAKARLESLSNTITDQVFEYWTQNKELDVEIDIRADPADPDPGFQSGPNLYIRVKNRKHRVTVPFSQRSKGFIWFFSFLVWFDSVQAEDENAPVVLLLDEPGLSLHGLAQADLLRYIDVISDRHQVIYTTHSPFMVHGDRLHQVRLVEDRPQVGSIVTDNVMGSDAKTLFPLQAALGYTVAQNLFISPRNLLVEGPADLIYIQFMSSQCEANGRVALRDDVTIVPVGGLDKVATFIALLGANQLELAVLHDLGNRLDARIESLVREKVIRDRQVLNYGMFRAGTNTTPVPTDVEDLFTPSQYLEVFNKAFARQLNGHTLTEAELPQGQRIIDRIQRYLTEEGVSLRPSGGFNHYTPASHLASHPIKPTKETLDCFEGLFKKVNSLFT